ncbi:MAG: acyltransferase [Bacilli bacterium]|nr:acyltransferase [Bacilli bacterium]
MAETKSKRNVAIQILRIIACLMVFIVHFGQRTQILGNARLMTEFGKNGVQLFFIISGLLAAMGLQKKEKISTYYKKRAINILPLYYIVILWYFITELFLNKYLHHIPIDVNGIGWFRYVFLLNGFIGNETYFWSNLGITWTIPIFAFFYLIIPFIIKLMKNYKTSFVVMIIIFFGTSRLNIIYPCTIFENISYFFIGTFVYYCWKDDKLRFSSIFFLIISIIYSIFGIINYHFIFATILSILLEKEVKLPNIVQKIIDRVDGYTYTFYLVHGIVFCSLLDKLPLLQITLSKFVIGFIAIVLSLTGTVIVHDFIEKPIQKFLSKRIL